MRVLVDTHVALWAAAAPQRLSEPARTALLGADELFLSVASLWEMAIKASRGKLELPGTIEGFAVDAGANLGIGMLDIHAAHLDALRGLPFHHADPFDRLLIAQARCEGLQLLTADAALAAYGVPLIAAG